MKHMQLQQEPETTLPRIEPSPFATDKTSVETLLGINQARAEEPSTLENLIAALEHDKQRTKWNARLSTISTVVFKSLLLIWIGYWIVTRQPPDFGSFSLVYLPSVFGGMILSQRLNNQAATDLTKLDDVKAVGILMDVWSVQGQINYSAKTRQQTQDALIRLLPRLTASDAHLLNETQREALRSTLRAQGNIPYFTLHQSAFASAIVKGLTQIGDWKSVPIIQNLVQPDSYWRVRELAQECLPALETLAEKQRIGETLLRSSSAADAATSNPDILLRPASPTSDVQPKTLLRPAE